MITVIVKFKLSEAITIQQAREIFLSTAPKYRGMPGLIRKYYLATNILKGTLWQLLDIV
jgi:hypothetical protein